MLRSYALVSRCKAGGVAIAFVPGSKNELAVALDDGTMRIFCAGIINISYPVSTLVRNETLGNAYISHGILCCITFPYSV